MDSSVHFSSKNEDCGTPKGFFNALDNEFDFDLDVCATFQLRKTIKYYSKLEDGFSAGVDGLRQPWSGHTCWCNPPYGRSIGDWTDRAVRFRDSATTVLLVPARTDTSWWFRLIRGASEVRFIVGRLSFDRADLVGKNKDDGAPFPSVVVVVDSQRKSLSVGWYSLDRGALIRHV